MGKDKGRRKKQTLLSLAPRDGSAPPPDLDRLATNEESQVASVRYGVPSASNHVKSTKGRAPSSRSHTARNIRKQGTLDMAFARAASRASDAAALGLPTPDASSQMQKRVLMSDSQSGVDSSNDEMLTTDRSKRKRTSFSTTNATAFFRPSASSPTDPIATPRSKAKQPQSTPKNSLFGSSPSARRITHVSSDEEDSSGPRKAGTQSSRKRGVSEEQSSGNRSARRSTRLQRADPSPTESDEDEVASPLRRKRLVRGRREEPSTEASDDSEDEVITPLTKRRNGGMIDEDEDASDSSEAVVTSSMRKRPRLASDEDVSASDTNSKKRIEKEDLDEDLEFLRDSSPPPGAGKKLSAREQHRVNLERMKARRASKGAIEISDDGEEDEDVVEDQSDLDEGIGYGYDHKDNLDDFVDDDDNDEELDIAAVEMPLEFTRHANKSVKEHFKDVVEWLVHNKLNPAFSRDDPIYRIGFRKVNDEVQGYAASKFTSSVWRPDFARALKARPLFHEEMLAPGLGEGDCRACGRSSHPATWVVTFAGKAYDPKTLENLKEDRDSDDSASEDSSDEEKDGKSLDVEGHLLPSESHRFFVGRNCKENSSQAHALTHWRWHLNDWIKDWLQRQGYLSAERVLERENLSARDRTKHANKVVDKLADEEVDNLWRDFKIQLDTAKEQSTNSRNRWRH